jgi:hypothetical protein
MIVEVFSMGLPAVAAAAAVGKLLLDHRQGLRHLLARRLSEIRPQDFADIEIITKACSADVCRMLSDRKMRQAAAEILILLCRAADANCIPLHWRGELNREEYSRVYQLLILAKPLVHLILPADCDFAKLYAAMGVSIERDRFTYPRGKTFESTTERSIVHFSPHGLAKPPTHRIPPFRPGQ